MQYVLRKKAANFRFALADGRFIHKYKMKNPAAQQDFRKENDAGVPRHALYLSILLTPLPIISPRSAGEQSTARFFILRQSFSLSPRVRRR